MDGAAGMRAAARMVEWLWSWPLLVVRGVVAPRVTASDDQPATSDEAESDDAIADTDGTAELDAAVEPDEAPIHDAIAGPHERVQGADEPDELDGARARPDGMGALAHEDGVTFRVWAPFADAVAVAGDFNDWSDDANPMNRDDDGVWSTDIGAAGDGDGYTFVIRNGDQVLHRIDPYARAVTNSAGHGIVRSDTFDWHDWDWRVPARDDLVIYEVHPGTYNDRPGGGPGSFDSVLRRLDHLVALGVSAIEIMPSMEFATDFSWGYNPAHIYAIEEAYGGPDALKRLVDQAHQRGIAVLFDVVYNHFGPGDLDLWRFDGWAVDGRGGIYFYNDERATTPWGDTRPDYGRGEVRRFLADNARWWLEHFHLDGLRWDATAWIRNVYGHNDDPDHDLADGWSLLQLITADCAERTPYKLHIAEDLRGNAWLTRDVDSGGAGFDSQWDDRFVHPVRAAMIAADDAARDMHALRHAIEHRYGADAFARVIYSESHDEVANGRARLPEDIWPGNAGSWHARKRSTLAAALVLTSPGIPMLFQGQELLEDQWFRDDDPIDWTRADTYAGVLALYRDLIAVRRNRGGVTSGLRGQRVAVHHVNDDVKVLAFHRWDRGGPGDDVVVVVNCSAQPFARYHVGLPRSGRWHVRLNTDWDGYSEDFGAVDTYDATASEPGADGMAWSGDVALGPYSAVILSQDD